jgi:Heterokaryon incompatibility protein (HET)
MKSTQVTFKYERPIGSIDIRLVQLLPAELATDVIRAQIVQIPVNPTPRYEALSYVWGSEERPRTIYCNAAPLAVTENLHRALIYLRDRISRTPADDYLRSF